MRSSSSHGRFHPYRPCQRLRRSLRQPERVLHGDGSVGDGEARLRALTSLRRTWPALLGFAIAWLGILLFGTR